MGYGISRISFSVCSQFGKGMVAKIYIREKDQMQSEGKRV